MLALGRLCRSKFPLPSSRFQTISLPTTHLQLTQTQTRGYAIYQGPKKNKLEQLRQRLAAPPKPKTKTFPQTILFETKKNPFYSLAGAVVSINAMFWVSIIPHLSSIDAVAPGHFIGVRVAVGICCLGPIAMTVLYLRSCVKKVTILEGWQKLELTCTARPPLPISISDIETYTLDEEKNQWTFRVKNRTMPFTLFRDGATLFNFLILRHILTGKKLTYDFVKFAQANDPANEAKSSV